MGHFPASHVWFPEEISWGIDSHIGSAWNHCDCTKHKARPQIWGWIAWSTWRKSAPSFWLVYVQNPNISQVVLLLVNVLVIYPSSILSTMYLTYSILFMTCSPIIILKNPTGSRYTPASSYLYNIPIESESKSCGHKRNNRPIGHIGQRWTKQIRVLYHITMQIPISNPYWSDRSTSRNGHGIPWQILYKILCFIIKITTHFRFFLVKSHVNSRSVSCSHGIGLRYPLATSQMIREAQFWEINHGWWHEVQPESWWIMVVNSGLIDVNSGESWDDYD